MQKCYEPFTTIYQRPKSVIGNVAGISLLQPMLPRYLDIGVNI